MNRRGFLKLAAPAAALASVGLLAPEIVRTYFLPPRAGWPSDVFRWNVWEDASETSVGLFDHDYDSYFMEVQSVRMDPAVKLAYYGTSYQRTLERLVHNNLRANISRAFDHTHERRILLEPDHYES